MTFYSISFYIISKSCVCEHTNCYRFRCDVVMRLYQGRFAVAAATFEYGTYKPVLCAFCLSTQYTPIRSFYSITRLNCIIIYKSIAHNICTHIRVYSIVVGIYMYMYINTCIIR